jgi:hypothetical protein
MALDGPPTTDGKAGLDIGPAAREEIADSGAPEARDGEPEGDTGTPAGTPGGIDWFGGVRTPRLSAWIVSIAIAMLNALLTRMNPIKIKIRVLKGSVCLDVKFEKSLVQYTFISFDEKAVEFLLLNSIRIVMRKRL